ncbi:rhodopsin [Lactobacillus sp. M0398]|uniref:rhodopsin n=1 Tax=unclassified Lactobacillus TaxID=2620435 RepID=UPI0018DD6D06|nr:MULTISPECIES: rhodopsin [unclassified Lactobacillus]MBI0120799.1 rhodopsin [Lactobacillus sp. M0398]MBI0122733.1 rhodopsin [Lactobacillus sp. W8174]MBI0135116.1 rhodopsin [Lactobacillus sp. W8173]
MPNSAIVPIFFMGVDFRAVKSNQVILPVFWFVYFVVPLLIVLSGIKQLWQVRGMQLRGLRYSPLSFTVVNVGLMGLITLIYVALTGGIITLVTDFSWLKNFKLLQFHGLSALLVLVIINFLGIFLLLIIQTTIGRFNAPLGIIIPFSWLIMAIYTTWKYNPLNSLMLLRVNKNNILLLLATTLLMLIIYLITDRYSEPDY